jgi:hypothetical protein
MRIDFRGGLSASFLVLALFNYAPPAHSQSVTDSGRYGAEPGRCGGAGRASHTHTRNCFKFLDHISKVWIMLTQGTCEAPVFSPYPSLATAVGLPRQFRLWMA